VSSYDWVISLGATPIGYALAPLTAQAWGEPAPLLMAGLLVSVGCAGTALVPEVRRVDATLAPPQGNFGFMR
jgi:hypothetical protein